MESSKKRFGTASGISLISRKRLLYFLSDRSLSTALVGFVYFAILSHKCFSLKLWFVRSAFQHQGPKGVQGSKAWPLFKKQGFRAPSHRKQGCIAPRYLKTMAPGFTVKEHLSSKQRSDRAPDKSRPSTTNSLFLFQSVQREQNKKGGQRKMATRKLGAETATLFFSSTPVFTRPKHFQRSTDSEKERLLAVQTKVSNM